jgi:predicted secreted protein
MRTFLLLFTLYQVSCDTVTYLLDQNTTNTTLWNINAYSGDSLTLALPGNPTTGFRWYIVDEFDTKLLQPLNLDADKSSTTYTKDQAGTNLVGSGGKFYFYFTTLKSGSTKIKFQYKRIWEEPNNDTRTVTASILIGSESRTSGSTYYCLSILVVLMYIFI